MASPGALPTLDHLSPLFERHFSRLGNGHQGVGHPALGDENATPCDGDSPRRLALLWDEHSQRDDIRKDGTASRQRGNRIAGLNGANQEEKNPRKAQSSMGCIGRMGRGITKIVQYLPM